MNLDSLDLDGYCNTSRSWEVRAPYRTWAGRNPKQEWMNRTGLDWLGWNIGPDVPFWSPPCGEVSK